MKIIEESNMNLLIADDGYSLKEKIDIYKSSYYDNQGNYIEEYIPYLFKKAYIPKNMTLEMLQEKYEEIPDDFNWEEIASEEDYLNALAKLGVE